MAVYFVTGKLGSGKSLAAIDKIRDRLATGRRVATNLDLYLDGMFTECRQPAIRLPDKPRAEDMIALGQGYDSENERDYDESKFGLIVLDECGTWLNSREWNDKERRKLIDWFLHARKYRWDVIFLIQSIDSCDGQIVQSLCEHLVVCRRMDRFKVMGIGLPRCHIANVYYGRSTDSYVERWVYRGNDLFDAYDTRQVFRDGVEYYDSGPVDMRAPYSYLSAWHLKGRYLAPEPVKTPWRARLKALALRLMLLPVIAPWWFADRRGCYNTLFRERIIREGIEQRRLARQSLLAIAYGREYPPLSN